jgi:lipid-A-disaccharide synthase
MAPFGEALRLVQERADRPLRVTLPAVEHLAGEIEARARSWPVRPELVRGEAAKWAAFRRAHAALAASGTVTLELGLAGVPMVVAYRVSRPEELLKHLITVPSIVLANLILGENAIPEFIQQDCAPETLAGALLPLLGDTPERARQASALSRLDGLMRTGDETPSARAARIVAAAIAERNKGP